MNDQEKKRGLEGREREERKVLLKGEEFHCTFCFCFFIVGTKRKEAHEVSTRAVFFFSFVSFDGRFE